MEIIYWAILVIWIIAIWGLKKNSGFSLLLAFVLFIISATLTVLTFRNLAEPIMRVSLIGWIVGIFQALIEYRVLLNKKDKTSGSEQQ